ncbi:MAG: glycosyltransferase [Gemmatimonadota bacterium]|nr:glycosyltransferase [Gemmatimonadota bacterium]MDH3426985.1 glycosyltransferase [Gemmatimonadota bacterium]
MNTSLLIATANRPDLLAAVLRGLARCRLPEGKFEVIVADNGDDPRTETVCREVADGLPVRYLGVAERGKSIALNQAVEVAEGDLLVFTDDDVEFDPDWLVELWRAALDYPDHVLFGGRVLPLWPDGIPARLEGSMYLGALYTQLDRGDEPGPSVGLRPFGPNMAVRRAVFDQGLRFDPTLGPGTTSGTTMGDETEIARELEARGEVAVYVPRSRVYHRVNRRQLSLRWQLPRAVRYGRLLSHIEGPRAGAGLLGRPFWLYRDIATGLMAAAGNAVLGRSRIAFDRLLGVAVSIGRAEPSGEKA